MAIQPARLVSRKSYLLPGQLHVSELFFEVPKNYANPAAGALKLFGRAVTKHEKPIVPFEGAAATLARERPYIAYLEGGPGFGNRAPQDHPLTQPLLRRGYQVLYLDYRGTGLSTPISADSVLRQGSPQAQADYLKLFRQDSIVRDLEAVRLCLTADFPPEKKQWSIIGQSFGGFVSLTYLSRYPQALRESFLTGGLAPVGRPADDVYRATFEKVRQRNRAYYEKYPEDVTTVRQIATHIRERDGSIPLPGGGRLTVARLLTLGISFGFHGGINSVHNLVLRMAADLDQFGSLGRSVLSAIEQDTPFDTNPIYAILHEAIYCYKPGVASNWAAYRVGKELAEFAWVAGGEEQGSNADRPPLYFSGEMIFPFHFETYPELARIREAAQLLAEHDGWNELYDEEQLRRNEVPVFAASFIEDMFVESNLARETAALVKGIRVYETNVLYHNALRAYSDVVLDELFKLRDDTID